MKIVEAFLPVVVKSHQKGEKMTELDLKMARDILFQAQEDLSEARDIKDDLAKRTTAENEAISRAARLVRLAITEARKPSAATDTVLPGGPTTPFGTP